VWEDRSPLGLLVREGEGATILRYVGNYVLYEYAMRNTPEHLCLQEHRCENLKR